MMNDVGGSANANEDIVRRSERAKILRDAELLCIYCLPCSDSGNQNEWVAENADYCKETGDAEENTGKIPVVPIDGFHFAEPHL